MADRAALATPPPRWSGLIGGRHRLTGQWHHLHQVSAVVMSREQAGHCPAGLGVRAEPALRRVAGRCGAAGFFGTGRNGAPGTRRWQNGQCSGPASKLLRQRPHVMVATSQIVAGSPGSVRWAPAASELSAFASSAGACFDMRVITAPLCSVAISHASTSVFVHRSS